MCKKISRLEFQLSGYWQKKNINLLNYHKFNILINILNEM